MSYSYPANTVVQLMRHGKDDDPAIGALGRSPLTYGGLRMLAERTTDHLRLFEEGREAEYFATPDELLAKVRHYLAHDDERRAIAEAGRERCRSSGYDLDTRARRMLSDVLGAPIGDGGTEQPA